MSKLESVLVCFSAGIDSTLLLAVASEQLRERAVGLTAVSPSLPEAEVAEARQIAEQLSVVVKFVESHELDRPDYARNEADRCFHCKTELYELAEQQRKQLGLNWIVNGTNADDLGDYRPGLEAAQRAGVLTPLLDLGFTKADIRAAAQEMGLEVWDKPAAACLSSRIPYGTSVTRERLAQIERFESELKSLSLGQVRVRWHDKIARIEVELQDIPRIVDPANRAKIVEMGQSCGFQFITLDLAGYRTGSLNELLAGRNLKLV
jgi:pyridinium-3,5-biscarboxylic acid mononucleotide sulfurtransferase